MLRALGAWSLRLDAAQRLGPRPVGLMLAARAARPLAAARLARAGAVPQGPFLPAPVGQALPADARLLAAARAVVPPRPAEGFDHAAPAARLNPLAGPDIRPVWEASRWLEIPLLALAERTEPGAGHLARAEAWLAAWLRLNPPFLGPNWACGQEAALRALHLALAVAELGGAPTAGTRALAKTLDRRIGANPLYALAQDNNHAPSEATGRMACALLLGDRAGAARRSAALDRLVLRLVAPDGGFAQDSPAYLRLLLDTLAVAERLRAAFGGPAMDGAARARAAAASRLLARLACPETGALSRLGHQDGSRFADLALAGPDDARASVARALAAFGAAPPEEGASWRGAQLVLLRAGRARAVLRLPRGDGFRPSHADALHLDLWDGPRGLLTDSGTGAYNPPPENRWWLDHFPSTAAHNTVEFDGESQMPRATRFLPAFWPEGGALGETGGWVRDRRGRRHEREVHASPCGRVWRVEDRVSGPFRAVALRWHLPPEGAAPRVKVAADAPLRVSTEQGWESPAYGTARPRPVLVARAEAPVSRLTTVISLD